MKIKTLNKEQKRKLVTMSHCALIDILAFVREGEAERASELAYVFPDLPYQLSKLCHWSSSPESLRLRIKDYEQEYGVNTGDANMEYLSAFDSIFPDIG